MSNPSFSNIDRWLFELIEGNLSEEQVAQLETFLMQHPELDVDRDMWELSKVDDFEVAYPHTEKMIRRRPVGLFMSMGMASIAGIIALATVMYWPSAEEQSTSVLTSQTKTKKTIDKVDLQSAETQTTSEDVTGSGTMAATATSTFQEVVPQAIQNQVGVEQTDRSNVEMASGEMANTIDSPNNVTNENSIHLSSLQQINEQTTVVLLSKQEEDKSVTTKEIEEVDAINEQSVLTEKVIQDVSMNETVSEQEVKTTTTPRTTQTHSVYKETFSSKLRQAGRALSRMLDNPVALKNLKDPHFHLPGMQPTEVNFGSVGTLLATRVQTISRLQWAGQPNQQLINSVSVDGYSYGMRGGLGLVLSHSQYADGGIQNIQSSFTYSPKFSVSRNVIVEPSFRFTMGNKTIDPTKIQTGSMVEMERLNPHQFYAVGQMPIGRSLWYRDLGLGLSVNTRWFYASVQGDNLLKHTDNIYSSNLTDIRRSGQHFIATLGTDYESRKENFGVSPYLVYQQYETLKEAWLGVNLRYQWITVGGAISSQLDPAVSVGIKFNHFMLAYNADMTHSEVLGKQFLSHQLTIRILTKPSRMGQRLLNL
jgi:hypothetical protein